MSPDVWLEILAWVKTLFELTKSTVDLVALERTHKKYRRDPEIEIILRGSPSFWRSGCCEHLFEGDPL